MKLQHSLTFSLIAILLIQVSTKLIIQSPPELKSKLQQLYPQGIHYSIANYGDVPFGKSLTGTIYMSSYLQNCQYQDLDQQSQRQINKVVLSTRGDCPFTTKSLNSQKQGAKLAIIADNQQFTDPGNIIMVDDGKGPQIKIPTILISHQAGQLITNTIINKKQNVSLIVNFQTIKKNKADVTLWMSSFDRKSYILIRDLQPYLTRITESINLSVYHPTTYCKNCPQTDCFNNHQYCINTGFYGYMIQGYGRQIIKQQLRQQIIMEKYPNLWWKYVQRYDQQCQDRATMSQCSIFSMNYVGINSQQINKIVQQSFISKTYKDEQQGTDRYTLDNKRLQKNNDLRYKSGILLFPAVIVNNITYRGNLDALQVFQLICQSLQNQPQGCNLQIKVNNGSPLRYLIVIGIIFICMMIFLVFCYRRQARRQISKNLNNQVNQLVNQYITMYQAQRFDNNQENTGSSAVTK